VLLALSLISTLKFSIDIFEQDKKSYIFENALKTNEQISSNLNDLFSKSKRDVILIKNLSKLSPLLAKSQINSSDYIVGLKLNKKIILNKSKSKLFKITSKHLKRLKTKNFENLSQELNSPVMAYEIIYKKSKMTAFIDYSHILRLIKSAQEFEISIYDPKGQSFFKSFEINNHLLNNLQNTNSNKITKEGIFNNKNYLYSFVRGSNSFSVLASISKNKAFTATEILKTKSLYFGLSLLFLFIIIGTFFGITLTRPIKKLVKGTQNVAEGIYDSPIELKSNDEFGILAKSFNSMSSEIFQLITKLEDYNKNLELKVQERTAQLSEANEFIKAMVNSLDQGLLVFDKEGKCDDIYTKACEKLFNKSPKDQSFDQVLNLDEKESKNFKSWVGILFQELLPFESSVALGPAHFKEGQSIDDNNFKQVNLSYYPIRDEKEQLTNIVSVATDVTKEVKAQKAFEEKEAYVSMVLKIINNKVQFFSFIKEVQSTLDNIKNTINSKDINLEYILMNWHSLNGGMGIFKIFKLSTMARENESYLVSIKEDIPKNVKDILIDQLASYQVALEEYLDSTSDIFGQNWKDEKERVFLTKAQLENLEDLINNNQSEQLKEFYTEQFEKTPIEEFFNGYIELVETSAKHVGKKISPLKISGGQLRINPKQHEELFSVMVHLFRNCVDHGIEAPSKRLESNKVENGQIEVEFQKIHSKGKPWLNIKVTDDGAGIDPKRIREKLSELHPNDKFDDVSDEEIIYKIFDPSFTTTETVTDLSGRGVGMSAIKDVIDKRKGSLKIVSKVGTGSEFNFSVPE
jgi:two-component system chemotaxis sensor kinase CheA